MNDLEKQVCEQIGESTTSPDVFSDITPIRDSINDAVAELNMVTGAYVRVYHLPLYVGRHFYRMAWTEGEFGYVVECWDQARKLRLEQTDLITLAATAPWFLKDSGNPDRYFQIGQSFIGIDRSPSASGKVLELTCVAIPARYTDDSQSVKLAGQSKRAAVEFAVSEYYASRGDAGRATEHLQKYLEFGNIAQLRPQQPERTFAYSTVKQGAGDGNI